MPKKYFAIIAIQLLSITAMSQHPLKHWIDAIETRYDSKQPVIHYSLAVDESGFSSFTVDMHVRNVPDNFQVAMVAHPEYDDRYWRYVTDLSVETKNGKGKVMREDSALWKISTTEGEAMIHYKINLPSTGTALRSAWKAYLTPTGGLVGGPHSFMYVVGATLASSHVTLKIPAGWEVATGLQSTSDPMTFFASSVLTLIDDPIFIGKFNSWQFHVDGIPHRVIYWPLPDAKPFDAGLLVSSVQKIVEQASLLFGRLPYREYYFMLQDGAVGGLEHFNSVTIGAPSDRLANGLSGTLSEITHEYFHGWNLMRIHPAEYTDVSYKTAPLSKGLWFSEGLTIFYADLLQRRAGIPVFDSTRLIHLENLIRRYSSNPAYQKFNAEQISLAAYGPTGMLGDYSAGTHLQGETFGAMLDLIIRDATNGQKTMDDVMRKMMERFSGEKGFTSKDIMQTITDVCGCHVQSFFNDHVFGSKAIDFKKYLRLAGLEYTIEWKDVLDSENKPVPDLRVFTYQLPGENNTRIGITNPQNCFGRSGLHTGDIIRSVNGQTVSNGEFRSLIRSAKIGDTIIIEVERSTGNAIINVMITGYQQPVVHIIRTAVQTERQKKLFEQWFAGN